MSQNILVTLISLALYVSSIIGGPGQTTSYRPSTTSTTSNSSSTSSSTSTAWQSSGQTPSAGVVTGNSVAVYRAVGSRESLAELRRGDYIDIIGREGSWYKVRLDSGQTGYVTSFTLMPADSAARPAASSSGTRTVLGYYVTDARSPSLTSLRSYYDTLTAISPWTWEVTSDGRLVQAFSSDDTSQALKFAGERGLRTYALIHNFTIDAKGNHNFNATLAHKLLSNPTARQRLIRNIKDTLTAWRMTGVHIDFEMVLAKDRQNLIAFMQELYNALHPAGFEVTMAVPSKTRDSVNDSWSGGYDYSTLARYVDQMVLMTYDEHWRGGEPGPVASINWVENVVRFALKEGVPSRKIVLGLAGYGYDWPRRGQARAVTYSQALSLVNSNKVSVKWDATAKVPYFRYGDGRQVWFENKQSISYKLALVTKHNLAGVALWRLGQEDPGIWPIIADML